MSIYFRWTLICLAAYACQRVAATLELRHDVMMLLCLHGPLNSIDAAHFAAAGEFGFLGSLIDPIIEELLFRKLLIGLLSRASAMRHKSLLVLLSAVPFALAHVDYWRNGVHAYALLWLLFYGVVLAKIFLYRGRVTDSMFAHIVTNALIAAPPLQALNTACVFVDPIPMLGFGVASMVTLTWLIALLLEPNPEVTPSGGQARITPLGAPPREA